MMARCSAAVRPWWGLALACMLLSSAACALHGARQTPPMIRLYRLNPAEKSSSPWRVAAPAAAPVAAVPAVLLVDVPEALAGFDTPRMAFTTRPHEVNYYSHDQWVDTPSNMLTHLLAQTLAASGTWQSVVAGPTPLAADWRFHIHDLMLSHERLHTPSRVRLSLHWALWNAPQQRVICAESFVHVEAAPSNDAYGNVIAANNAVEVFLYEVRQQVLACVKSPPATRPPPCGTKPRSDATP